MRRRTVLQAGLLAAAGLSVPTRSLRAQSPSLSDVGGAFFDGGTCTREADAECVTIFKAREIVTLNPGGLVAEAVAVINGHILSAGTLEQVEADLDTRLRTTRPYKIDTTFEDKVLVPGFIAQHDHPVLAALTMTSEILSIEDWELPSGTVKAVESREDFLDRLSAASGERRYDPYEPLLTWGYHPAFWGKLTRADLDKISEARPIFSWARSCHEFVLNSAAMELGDVTQDLVDSWPESARDQSDFGEGRFWEQGLFAVLPNIAGLITDPDRFRHGLEIMRDYMHAKGVTYGNEPGGILNQELQDAVNEVMSAPTMPFRWSFMPDGKSLIALYDDDSEVLEKTEELATWYHGMTSFADKSVKLFSDGAIYSLAMQLRDPYEGEGEYHGEWMMDLDQFERAFRIYWEAGYQLHIHVNGDAGLDRVLNTLEDNFRHHPRYDHRTTIVHFAVSAPDQVERIRRLGAIVSGNPYYVTALADQYTDEGLGEYRAHNMVRLGDVARAGIPFSLHSDMPMAPGDPLFLMWCAVNRITSSGDHAVGEDQKVSAEAALRAVTIEAAYSHRLEHERGSIEPGKLANFTVLEKNPLNLDSPEEIKDIGVWGTVMEGRKFEVKDKDPGDQDAGLRMPRMPAQAGPEFATAALKHALSAVHVHE